MVGDVAIQGLQNGDTAEEDMTKERQTRQPETIQPRQTKRQERQLETRQKEEVVRGDEPTTGLQIGDAAEGDMTGKRQKRQPEERQTRQLVQDVRLSPEQQKIADLVGRGVNTVKEIAKELDMGEAATRTQIKRMIEKGCVEVVSSEDNWKQDKEDKKDRQYKTKNTKKTYGLKDLSGGIVLSTRSGSSLIVSAWDERSKRISGIR
jgi:DNA-binding CsgD family transcriptional regulator